VNDSFSSMRPQSFSQRRSVGQISVHKPSALNNGWAMTFVEAVINDNLVAVLQQFFGDHAADITGTTGY